MKMSNILNKIETKTGKYNDLRKNYREHFQIIIIMPKLTKIWDNFYKTFKINNKNLSQM